MEFKRKDLFSSKYFRKLAVFGLILGCVPAITIGFFSYGVSSGITEQKVREQNAQILLQTQTYMEHILMNTDTALRGFAESSVTAQAMDSGMKGQDFELYQAASRKLGTTAPAEIVDSDACLVNFAQNWVINNSGLYRLDEAENSVQYQSFANLPRPSMWVVSLDQTPNALRYDSFFSGDAVYLVKRVPLNFVRPQVLAAIKIPCRYLSNALAFGDGAGQMVILDEAFRVIGDTNNQAVGEDWSGSELEQRIKDQGPFPDWFEFSSGQGGMSVTCLRSDYNGWYYLSLVSVESVVRDSRTIGWFTAGIVLCCVAAVMVMALVVSHRMSQPILDVYKNLLPKDTVGAGKDELQFIGTQVSALLESRSRMETQMYGQLQQLKEYFTIKILLGNVHSQELEKRLQMIGNARGTRFKSVLALQPDSLENSSYTEADQDILMFAVNNVVEELLRGVYLLTPVVLDQSQVTVVGGDQESAEQFAAAVGKLAETIQQTVNRSLNLSISVGISRTFSGYRETSPAYQEAAEAIHYRVRLDANVILFREKVHPSQTLSSLAYLSIKRKLIQAVRDANEEDTMGYLDDFLADVFARKMSPEEYQICMASLFTELVLTMQEINADYVLPQTGQGPLLEQLFARRTPQEIRDWLAQTVIEPFLLALREESRRHCKRLAQEMQRLVETEFDQPLTVELCGERLNYHPTYLRRVFLREMGVPFGEYLTRCRLDAAKKMLRETDMHVCDIAQKLQYSNSQNFIRTFKKAVGMTPGQYKESAHTDDFRL